jgi:phosphohistidine phosphatase SixA
MAEETTPTPSKTWAEFLASSPPDTQAEISDLFTLHTKAVLETPDVLLFCDSEECQGILKFERTSGYISTDDHSWQFEFLHYRCRNCRRKAKTYAVAVRWDSGTSGRAQKIGEIPPFGPHTPTRVISLIGPDKELYLRGRRSENRGLGIGAFSYYRRVVESQKGRIIQEIAKVAKKLGAKPEVLKRFEAAAKETQFSKAIEEVKDGIPSVLLIDGQHNPLTLLHSALSEGLHEHTDEECLEIAKEVRIVLTDLADRLSQALKEHAELKNAVTRLMSRKFGAATTTPEEPSSDPSST